jgi:hypothetical protein
VTDLQLDEMVRPFALGRLEARVREESEAGSLAIPATAWRGAFFPERMFLSDEIGGGHGPYFDAAFGRTPFVQIDRLENWLREEEGIRQQVRSAIMLRDLLIGLVMDGVMTSTDAETFARRWRVRALSSRPRERLFDVNREPAWSLVMTISWIVWRSPRKVREAWDDYRTECWEWFGMSRRLPVDGGTEWYEVHGEELRALEPLSVMSLGILEAVDADPDDQQKLVSVKTAREDLWQRLADGHIGATGLNANNSIVQIPAHEWPYLELAGDLTGHDYVIQRSLSLKAVYSQLRFSRLAVQGTWPKQGEADEAEPDPTDSLFDLGAPAWTLHEAAIWVGSEGRRFGSQKIADEDLESTGAIVLFEGLFGDSRLAATGIGPKLTREVIPAEFWELATIDPALASQRHYVSFIDELLEHDNGGQMTPFGEHKPRWHGIRLQRDALFEVFPDFAPTPQSKPEAGPVKSSVQRRSPRKLDATKKAIASVFPKGIPSGLSDKERVDSVNAWLETNGHSSVSLSTIERAAKAD